jgi:hypothetical protein
MQRMSPRTTACHQHSPLVITAPCLPREKRSAAERARLAKRGAVKTVHVTELLQPRLADHVHRACKSAFDRAVQCSVEEAARPGVSDPMSLGVLHPAHRLNFLHRTLGFAGCPTDPVWPKDLSGLPCVPVPGVTAPDEHGVGRLGAVVGCSLPATRFPFTSVDDLAGVHVVVELPVGSADLVGCQCPVANGDACRAVCEVSHLPSHLLR